MLDAISIRQLRSFAAVAFHKSFSIAADALNVTQPAVTQHIKQLEGHLKLSLFDRNPRNVGLTRQGVNFLESVQILLRDFDMMVENARALAEHRRGTARIASASSMVQTLLLPAVKRLREDHPGIATVTVEVDDPAVHELVRSGHVEFALTGVPSIAPDLSFEELFQDRACVVFAKGHAFGRFKIIRAAQLAGLDFIRAPRNTASENFAVRLLTEARIAVNTVCEVSQLMSAAAMVERGVGIAILPALSCATISRFGVEWRPLVEPSLWRVCGIAAARQKALSPVASILRSYLLAALAPALGGLKETLKITARPLKLGAPGVLPRTGRSRITPPRSP